MRIQTRRGGQHGQVMVIMALAIVVMLALVGLVIDGGNAWGQQRITQNGTDAAAQAGATVLAQKLSGSGEPAGGWDGAVLAAVNGAATANGLGDPPAYYTDICGLLLTPSGTQASGTGDAARVGSGFPTSASITPDCPNHVPGPVAGVYVLGSKSFSTYFAGVVGIHAMSAGATATAVTGFVDSCQDVEQGCTILPITASIWFTTCVKNKSVEQVGTQWSLNTRYVLPMCGIGSGNFGWLDWTPPAGGASEVADSILHPNNPPIALPSWQYVTQTGKINSSQVENALNTYDGQVVMFPLYDHTCGIGGVPGPNQSQAGGVSPYGCTPTSALDDPKGTNNWWRIPQFAAFKLEHAYTNGTDGGACGGVSHDCLVGEFVKFVVSGTVGPGSGGGSTSSSVIGVQLIK